MPSSPAKIQWARRHQRFLGTDYLVVLHAGIPPPDGIAKTACHWRKRSENRSDQIPAGKEQERLIGDRLAGHRHCRPGSRNMDRQTTFPLQFTGAVIGLSPTRPTTSASPAAGRSGVYSGPRFSAVRPAKR